MRGELSDSFHWDAADDEVVRLETEFKDVLPIYAKEIKVETVRVCEAPGGRRKPAR
jgi:hypothetical protein